MTENEKLVWAAAFAAISWKTRDPAAAARFAGQSVMELRDPSTRIDLQTTGGCEEQPLLDLFDEFTGYKE